MVLLFSLSCISFTFSKTESLLRIVLRYHFYFMTLLCLLIRVCERRLLRLKRRSS